MNPKNKVFVFDMDGVIVETIEPLYSIYLEFLNEFQIKGTKEEFEVLNGPKIEEIVEYLKIKYNLQQSKEELLKGYNKKIESIYSKVTLIKGIKETLESLKKNKFKIALASSSKMKNIEFVLKKFDLKHYFDFIISGDEVKEAKPSPAVYNLVKDHFKDYEFYVIEDSQNGLKSALSAGMNTIFFNPKQKETEIKVSYNISKIEEIKEIINEIKINCKIIALSNKIEFKPKEYKLNISSNQEKNIEMIWEREKKKNPYLYNGKIISYISYNFEMNNLIIEYFITEYKFFLAQLNTPNLNLNIAPIAVSGIILDKGGNTLIAKRKDVTEYKDFYEFVPSGGISALNIKGEEVLFIKQLKDEFKEETKISLDNIKEIKPFCLILDKKHNVYDICCKILLKTQIQINGIEDEYTNLKIININSLEDFVKKNKFIPTSKMILEIIKEKH